MLCRESAPAGSSLKLEGKGVSVSETSAWLERLIRCWSSVYPDINQVLFLHMLNDMLKKLFFPGRSLVCCLYQISLSSCVTSSVICRKVERGIPPALPGEVLRSPGPRSEPPARNWKRRCFWAAAARGNKAVGWGRGGNRQGLGFFFQKTRTLLYWVSLRVPKSLLADARRTVRVGTGTATGNVLKALVMTTGKRRDLFFLSKKMPLPWPWLSGMVFFLTTCYSCFSLFLLLNFWFKGGT